MHPLVTTVPAAPKPMSESCPDTGNTITACQPKPVEGMKVTSNQIIRMRGGGSNECWRCWTANFGCCDGPGGDRCTLC
ncbi:hypothetical protein ONS96_004236 [Cadophora gregata f. sp. sojae]|nr:hypothetical protein ONS96_004236 [Cadophora gregata f. sp. sojae]